MIHYLLRQNKNFNSNTDIFTRFKTTIFHKRERTLVSWKGDFSVFAIGGLSKLNPTLASTGDDPFAPRRNLLFLSSRGDSWPLNELPPRGSLGVNRWISVPLTNLIVRRLIITHHGSN